MILVRVVFQAKNGKASELVAGMKDTIKHMTNPMGDTTTRVRLLTDLSGPFDTVVMETEHASLAAWEQARALMFTTPAFQENQPRAQELVISGRHEYYTIEANT